MLYNPCNCHCSITIPNPQPFGAPKKPSNKPKKSIKSFLFLASMEVQRVYIAISLLMALACSSTTAQSLAPPPAPTSDGLCSLPPAPTSDGVAIDQGVAHVLMLVAVVLTYIIH